MNLALILMLSLWYAGSSRLWPPGTRIRVVRGCGLCLSRLTMRSDILHHVHAADFNILLQLVLVIMFCGKCAVWFFSSGLYFGVGAVLRDIDDCTVLVTTKKEWACCLVVDSLNPWFVYCCCTYGFVVIALLSRNAHCSSMSRSLSLFGPIVVFRGKGSMRMVA